MRPGAFALILAGFLPAALAVAQPSLVCPTAPAGRACDAYHYHVQMYRPDTKQWVEATGTNQFATQAACDRARDMYVGSNEKVVAYFRNVREQQYEADRVGVCHCDMTSDRAAPNFLTDVQRTAQLRMVEEVRLRVRERLLDNKLTSESEIVRGIWSDAPATPLLGGPRLVPIPQTSNVPVLTATEDLKATRTVDTSKPSAAAMDLPLIDLQATASPAAEGTPQAAVVAEGIADAPPVTTAEPTPAPMPAPAPALPEPTPTETIVAAPAETEPASADAPVATNEAEEDLVSAEETAERFVSYETQRIQNVLRAAGAIADENVKSRIFEACMQRIQLLSNLRLLIEGSGMRSRLAAAARDAQEESDRLELIARLFGEDIKPHWAPKDAADVVFEIEPAVAEAPEKALRDTTGQVSTEQKKRALYLLLAQTQPTEDQRLWLSTVVEGFLR
jgi:hypothetical protein